MPWQFTSTSPNRKVDGSRTPLKRKFPGPAGLLIPNSEQHTQAEHKLNGSSLSQNTMAEFTEGPWEQMRKDFEILSERNVYLPDKYSIAWVKSMAKHNKLPNQKVPFLAGIISKVNAKPSIITITLKDVTDQINGVIVNALFDDYHKVLMSGSVIVLRQVSVLTTRNSNCYLTITANNLVRIYNSGNVISLRHCTVNDFMHGVKALTTPTVYCKMSAEKNESKVDGHASLSIEDKDVLDTIFDGVDADVLFDDF